MAKKDVCVEPKADVQGKQKMKDPSAVDLGRRGGLKGGPARAKKLSAEERSDIAKKAAKDRWEQTAEDEDAILTGAIRILRSKSKTLQAQGVKKNLGSIADMEFLANQIEVFLMWVFDNEGR